MSPESLGVLGPGPQAGLCLPWAGSEQASAAWGSSCCSRVSRSCRSGEGAALPHTAVRGCSEMTRREEIGTEHGCRKEGISPDSLVGTCELLQFSGRIRSAALPGLHSCLTAHNPGEQSCQRRVRQDEVGAGRVLAPDPVAGWAPRSRPSQMSQAAQCGDGHVPPLPPPLTH